MGAFERRLDGQSERIPEGMFDCVMESDETGFFESGTEGATVIVPEVTSVMGIGAGVVEGVLVIVPRVTSVIEEGATKGTLVIVTSVIGADEKTNVCWGATDGTIS